MTGSDYFALGVYRALVESERSIPEQVAVIGYGDHLFSAYLNPPLSSVRLPAAEIGTTAVNLLLGRLRGRPGRGESQKIRLETTLAARASTERGRRGP
jgi:LacI family transcriptional regulator